VRVARYYRNDEVRLEEMERPSPGPGELLVRVEASGICGSDVLEWYRVPKAPLVLGHEIAGEVVEAGEGVKAFGPGDRVMATHHVPCNTCRYCLRGHHSLCDTLRSTRFDPGGFSEYLRLPAINVDRGTFRLPEQVSYEKGSFLEPLACCVRGQRLAGVGPGDSVLVLGSGLSGALHILLARALGASRILATDPSPWRREMAGKLGADSVIPSDDDVPGRVRDLNGGRGVDRVLLCTAAPSAFDQAFRSADRGGTILIFGVAEPGTTVPYPAFDLWNEGITLLHTYAGAPGDIETALELIASGRIDPTPTVTHRLPLEETQKGFRLVAQAGASLKVIIEPQR
jgi:L-iditol 2-dehydrogenase